MAMESAGVWLLLAAVFAPALVGALTMLLPRTVHNGRTIAALLGPVVSLGALLAFASGHGVGAVLPGVPFVPSMPLNLTFNADGLVGQSGPLERGARAVLVTDCARDANGSRAVGALLERAGGTLLGVAALVDAESANLTPLASLCSLRRDLASPPEHVSGPRGAGGAR